jgi:hypothetical protein
VNKTLTCTATSIGIGTAAIAGNTYSWSPAAGLNNASIAEPTATTPNVYTVTVTNTANGCTSADAVTVSQNITPPVVNAGSDKTLTCTTTSVTLGTAAIAGNTYAWTPAGTLNDATLAQPSTSTQGVYTLTVTNTVNGCQSTDTVRVLKDITPPVADAGTDITLTCAFPSIKIGTPAIGGNTYSWNPSVGLNNANAAQPSASIPGVYTVTVTKTLNGCTSQDAVTVLIDTIHPVANAGVDQTLNCTITSVQIGSAAIGGNTYLWSPSLGLSDDTLSAPVASKPDTYTVTVTKTSNGCKTTDAVAISQDTLPPVAKA